MVLRIYTIGGAPEAASTRPKPRRKTGAATKSGVAPASSIAKNQ
jgi:hypothetical protein